VVGTRTPRPRIRSLAVLGCIAALGLPALAQAETLSEVFKLARQNDPKYRAAQFDFQATGTQSDQALAGLLPTVKYEQTASDTRQQVLKSNNPIFGTGLSVFPTDVYTLSISQPLFRMDLIERFRQVKAVQRQANFTLLAAEQDLMLRTTTAYLTVLAAEDGLALAKAERAAVARGLEFAREKLRSGVGTITNLNDATARHAMTMAREIEANNKLNDARQGLKEITGKYIDKNQTLQPKFLPIRPDPLVVELWVEKAYEQNLLLQAKSEAVDVARQEIQRQRAGHYPSLNVVGTQVLNNSGSTLFGGGSETKNTVLTLQLSVPIYQGGLVNAVTNEAAFRYQKALEEREQERRAVERQTRASFEGAISGIDLVEALTLSVSAQQSAAEGKVEGFMRGVYTFLAVLDAQRDLYIAKRDYAQARYDYLVNSLKLKQAAGTLSEKDVEAVNAALQ